MRCHMFYVTASYKCKSIVIIFHRMLTFTFTVIFFLLGVGKNFLFWFSVVRRKLLLPQSKNFVGFVRSGGNDFFSVTIDL